MDKQHDRASWCQVFWLVIILLALVGLAFLLPGDW